MQKTEAQDWSEITGSGVVVLCRSVQDQRLKILLFEENRKSGTYFIDAGGCAKKTHDFNLLKLNAVKELQEESCNLLDLHPNDLNLFVRVRRYLSFVVVLDQEIDLEHYKENRFKIMNSQHPKSHCWQETSRGKYFDFEEMLELSREFYKQSHSSQQQSQTSKKGPNPFREFHLRLYSVLSQLQEKNIYSQIPTLKPIQVAEITHKGNQLNKKTMFLEKTVSFTSTSYPQAMKVLLANQMNAQKLEINQYDASLNKTQIKEQSMGGGVLMLFKQEDALKLFLFSNKREIYQEAGGGMLKEDKDTIETAFRETREETSNTFQFTNKSIFKSVKVNEYTCLIAKIKWEENILEQYIKNRTQFQESQVLSGLWNPKREYVLANIQNFQLNVLEEFLKTDKQELSVKIAELDDKEILLRRRTAAVLVQCMLQKLFEDVSPPITLNKKYQQLEDSILPKEIIGMEYYSDQDSQVQQQQQQ